LPVYARAWFGAAAPLHLSALERRLGTPPCTSIGRLFDAIAALAGLIEPSTYEGETAIMLEELAAAHGTDRAEPSPYPFPLDADGVADTRPLVAAVLKDVDRNGKPAPSVTSRVARRFHEALVDLGIEIVQRAGIPDVVLSGGCFQNRFLAERLERRLDHAGFSVHLPAAVPTNDGGISVGQAWLAAREAASK
jgi:hydrogenase maturation protein HypF